MKALTDTQLLRLWERGIDRHPVERALIILAEAEPDASLEALSSLSVGLRDHRLLALRSATFGPQLQALVACSACGERLEIGLSASDLQQEGHPEEEAPPARIQVGEFALDIRLPTSDDLAAASTCADIESAERMLAVRCVDNIWRGDTRIAPDAILDDIVPIVADHLDGADATGDMTLAMTCPVCTVCFESAFDIASFFWTEIEAESLRLLRDVHRLARGYGWREADILSMPPFRRRVYLELLQA